MFSFKIRVLLQLSLVDGFIWSVQGQRALTDRPCFTVLYVHDSSPHYYQIVCGPLFRVVLEDCILLSFCWSRGPDGHTYTPTHIHNWVLGRWTREKWKEKYDFVWTGESSCLIWVMLNIYGGFHWYADDGKCGICSFGKYQPVYLISYLNDHHH